MTARDVLVLAAVGMLLLILVAAEATQRAAEWLWAAAFVETWWFAVGAFGASTIWLLVQSGTV